MPRATGWGILGSPGLFFCWAVLLIHNLLEAVIGSTEAEETGETGPRQHSRGEARNVINR